MIDLRKIKYNLILGILIGVFLAQLVLAEGYAILAAKQQHNNVIINSLPIVDIKYFKILALLIFIITIWIFCTKRFVKINLNKISIYLFLVVVISLIVAIQGTIILCVVIFSIHPKIKYYVSVDYFISINMVYLMCFIGVGIFFITFLFLVNRKVKYIKFLTTEVKSIKEEGFGKTIEVKGEDELAELCSSINEMSIELREKMDNEKRIENTKNELITNISHDLKTPLTSIIGYLELLNNKEFKEEYVKIAYDKSLRLKDLINELFEYTKLNSSDMKIEKVRFNISNLINQIVGESILAFSERGIEVNLENPYKELYCDIDVKLISRVFENLLKNAEKYSDNNSIFRVIVEENERNITMYFINKCEKINQNDLDKIFEKFYRLDEARNSENEGSGLGLTIAKRIVELHDGEIIVEKNKENIKFKIILNKENYINVKNR